MCRPMCFSDAVTTQIVTLAKEDRFTMKPKKDFDCVEYKHAIQAKHAKETNGLTPREKTQSRRESDNPAARLWRRMRGRQQSVLKD